MRSAALLTLLLISISLGAGASVVGEAPAAGPIASIEGPLPAGTVVPRPPEPLSDEATPLRIRIVNRAKKPIYLQGFRQGKERVQIYLYHRDEKGGWKPFFDALPCDLPTCRTLHAPRKVCPKPIPFVVTLGPAGGATSVKEISWEGALYQRSEATQEDRGHRYCYKGWVPKGGRMRVEVEFSDSIQQGGEKTGMIGARDHAVAEFDLPPALPQYDVIIEEGGGSVH